MPAAVSRAPLCIPSDCHCRKCTIYICPVRAHNDDPVRSFAHENRGIRPSDRFEVPKDLQSRNRINTYLSKFHPMPVKPIEQPEIAGLSQG